MSFQKALSLPKLLRTSIPLAWLNSAISSKIFANQIPSQTLQLNYGLIRNISHHFSLLNSLLKPNNVSLFKEGADNNNKEKINPFDLFKKPRSKPSGNEPDDFSRERLIEGLKHNAYRRIVFLTGAGISVSSGIPDFRSPKTGIYSKLNLGLDSPEDLFNIKHFRHNPQPFYSFLKELTHFKAKPTIAHYFMKIVADNGTLLCNFTQNIDGLETKAGIDPDFLVEAHGHTRTASCVECKKKVSAEEFFKHVEQQKIYKCECGGNIKPDVVFFGERLPERFDYSVHNLPLGDLVIVMGTSLQVFPFASLIDMVSEEVPLV